MAEQKNKSAEQLLSDLHQKRLEQALNEFNADKTRMAVGRLLEEYVMAVKATLTELKKMLHCIL
jgi:predicted DNA binding CopG/RHH family protein